MQPLGRFALAFVAATLLHLGVVWLAGKVQPPSPRRGPFLSVETAPALQWLEVAETFLPPVDRASPPGEEEEEGGTPPNTAVLPPATPTQHRPKTKPRLLPAKALPPRDSGGQPPATLAPSAKEEKAAQATVGSHLPGDDAAQGGNGGPLPGNGNAAFGPGGEAPLARGPGGLARNKGGRDGDAALQQRLQAQARGCYPARLRRLRFGGTTQLAFCVDLQGMARQTRLVHSSGHGSLDEAAVECVLKKAQPLPPSSYGQCFLVPIAFGP